MPTVSSGILFDANTFNLKEIKLSEVRNDAHRLLTADESIVYAFMTIRDQVLSKLLPLKPLALAMGIQRRFNKYLY